MTRSWTDPRDGIVWLVTAAERPMEGASCLSWDVSFGAQGQPPLAFVEPEFVGSRIGTMPDSELQELLDQARKVATVRTEDERA